MSDGTEGLKEFRYSKT